MSKSVTIPTYMKPDWVCTINNTTYRYKAGTTQTVPDAVAALIANINAQEPVENPPETEEQMAERVAGEVAEEKIRDAFETFPEYIDLSDVSFTLGTSKPITQYLPKTAAEKLMDKAFERPTSICVKVSSIKYVLPPTSVVGNTIVFSAPRVTGGEVADFLTLTIMLEGDIVDGLLQVTEMPE